MARYNLVILVLVVMLCGYWFEQKIELNEGLGWDGAVYGWWVVDFHGIIIKQGTNPYYAQRVFPFAMVHYLLRGLRVPLTLPHVVQAFGLLSVAMMTLAAWSWCRIADVLKLSQASRWLGAIGLFANFMVLKWFIYDPVLTDAFAFTLSILMLQAFLTDRPGVLLVLTAIGTFTWPTLFYQGAFLLIFPRPADSARTVLAPRYRLNTILAGLVVIGFIAFSVIVAEQGLFKTAFSEPGEQFRSQFVYLVHSHSKAVGIAGIITVSFLFGGLMFLLNDRALYMLANWRRWTRWQMLLAVGLLAVASRYLVHRISNGPALMGLFDTLYVCTSRALHKPGGFCLTHVIFFGPFFVLIMLRWPQVCQEMSRMGPGVMLGVVLNFFLALDSETRHILTIFPTLVVVGVLAMRRINWWVPHYVAFGVLSLFCSKVWLPLPGKPDHLTMSVTTFPAQRFFMSCGPFISWDMYYVQGSVLLLVAGILAFMLWQGTRLHPQDREARPGSSPDQMSPAPLAA